MFMFHHLETTIAYLICATKPRMTCAGREKDLLCVVVLDFLRTSTGTPKTLVSVLDLCVLFFALHEMVFASSIFFDASHSYVSTS